MLYLKKIAYNYFSFVLGTLFGAVVATFTSYAVFSVVFGEIEYSSLLSIEECLLEKAAKHQEGNEV